jgi:ribosome-associated protein
VADSKPSKSALKREDKALKALGDELVLLSGRDLDRLPLDERLRDAIDAAVGMRAHGAQRRQRQLIGKLLRQADADAIRQALSGLTADSVIAKRRFREAETWRDRLVADGYDAVDACHEATGTDRTTLHDLVAQHTKARSDKAVKTARKRLFRAIRNALDSNGGT